MPNTVDALCLTRPGIRLQAHSVPLKTATGRTVGPTILLKQASSFVPFRPAGEQTRSSSAITHFRAEFPQEMDYNLSAPAMAPPVGVTTNFENPPSRNAEGRALLALMMVISTGCILPRGWAKWLTRMVHIEDYMILGAYVGS